MAQWIGQRRSPSRFLVLMLLLTLAFALVASFAIDPAPRSELSNVAIAPEPAGATASDFMANDSLDAISTFAAFVTERNGGLGAGDNTYPPDGLRKLADALDAVAARSTMKDAEALAGIQRLRYAHLKLAAAEVQSAADGVAAERRISEQASAINLYFERASDLIRAMGGLR